MFGRWFRGNPQREYAQAIEAFNRGDYAAARDGFERALAEQSDPTHPHNALARFYRAEALSRLGREELAAGRDPQALHHLDAALEEQPGYPDLHFRRGVALLRSGDPVAAEQAARSALHLNHEFLEARVLLFLAHEAQGNPVLAGRELDVARELGSAQQHPLSPCLAVGQAPTLDDLGRHLFSEQDRKGRIARAETLYHEGFWDESRKLLRGLVAESPTWPDLRLRLAACEFQLGDADAAADQLEEALQQNPQFADALVLYGTVELRRQRWVAASRRLEAGHALGMPSPYAQYALAVARVVGGDFAGARDLLEPLLEAGDAPAEAGPLSGLLLGALGEFERADARFASLIADGAPDLDLLLDAIAVRLRLPTPDRASRTVTRLPAGAPSPSVALARARVLAARGNPGGALDVLDVASGAHPQDPALLLETAQIRMELGEREAALHRVDALLVIRPGHAAAHRLRARLLREAGQLPAALAALRRAISSPDAARDLALERLTLLRLTGDSEEAVRLTLSLAETDPLDPAIRLQDIRRWLTCFPSPGLAVPVDA